MKNIYLNGLIIRAMVNGHHFTLDERHRCDLLKQAAPTALVFIIRIMFLQTGRTAGAGGHR